MPKRFTEEELKNIINDYKQGNRLCDIAKKYDRKPEVILAKLQSIGIYENKTIRWNKEEIQILKDNYSTLNWNELLKLLHRHKKRHHN